MGICKRRSGQIRFGLSKIWPLGARAPRFKLEYFAGPIGIAKQPCADAADRVAELDRVPPGTVRRALDASSRIGYAQRPATKDQPTPIEDSPVCLSPPLVGLEDELGALLRIAKKPLPERPECVV